LILSGSVVYVGGSFTTIGGQVRNSIAALDINTGLATAWNPNANNYVRTLAISGSTMYAGGDFTAIGGQSRNRIAVIDTITGLATGWDPNANDRVFTIFVSRFIVYVGGDFTIIAGQARTYFVGLLFDQYNVIEGVVFQDGNGDGFQGVGELPRANTMVKATDGINTFYTFTDVNGFYSLYTIEGNYTVTTKRQYCGSSLPTSRVVNFIGFGNTSSNNHFGLQCSLVTDVAAYSTCMNPVRQGRPLYVNVIPNSLIKLLISNNAGITLI